jgi:hypothetical protein
MASYSQFLSHKVLNWLRGTALGAAPDAYLGLYDGSTEVTTGVRAAGRVGISFGAPDNDAGGRAIQVAGETSFGEADGVEDVDFIGVSDAVSAGNLLLFGALAQAKQTEVGKVFKVKNIKFNTTGDLTEHTKDVVLDWIRGNASAAAPSTVFLALFNGVNEVTSEIRTAGRLAITFDAPSAKVMVSDVAVNFGESAGDVSITHGVLFTAATGGTELAKAFITGATAQAPIEVDAGDEVIFEAGDVSVQVL